MAHCKNCGHESHCGASLRKDFYNGDTVYSADVEVCKHCICDACENKHKDIEDANSKSI